MAVASSPALAVRAQHGHCILYTINNVRQNKTNRGRGPYLRGSPTVPKGFKESQGFLRLEGPPKIHKLLQGIPGVFKDLYGFQGFLESARPSKCYKNSSIDSILWVCASYVQCSRCVESVLQLSFAPASSGGLHVRVRPGDVIYVNA